MRGKYATNKYINSPAGGFNPNNTNRKHHNLIAKGDNTKHLLIKQVSDVTGPVTKALSKSQVRELYAAYGLDYVVGQADIKKINSGGHITIEKYPNGFGKLIKQ